jgi:hypothetical protein
MFDIPLIAPVTSGDDVTGTPEYTPVDDEWGKQLCLVSDCTDNEGPSYILNVITAYTTPEK